MRREDRHDSYWRMARDRGYRSRAVFKLMEIDRGDRLLRPGQTVMDLGAAPGGWSQYLAERVGRQGRVLAIDRNPMQPIPGVEFALGELGDPGLCGRCREWLGGRPCDLVVSDLAPDLSGIAVTDQARMAALLDAALEMARQFLRPEGDLLIKLFQGEECAAFRERLAGCFRGVAARRPRASRSSSKEFYLLARRLTGLR